MRTKSHSGATVTYRSWVRTGETSALVTAAFMHALALTVRTVDLHRWRRNLRIMAARAQSASPPQFLEVHRLQDTDFVR